MYPKRAGKINLQGQYLQLPLEWLLQLLVLLTLLPLVRVEVVLGELGWRWILWR